MNKRSITAKLLNIQYIEGKGERAKGFNGRQKGDRRQTYKAKGFNAPPPLAWNHQFP